MKSPDEPLISDPLHNRKHVYTSKYEYYVKLFSPSLSPKRVCYSTLILSNLPPKREGSPTRLTIPH